jgi:hypothetical protein
MVEATPFDSFPAERGAGRSFFGGRELVQALLRVEGLRVAALAEAGALPAGQARSIADTCKVDLFNPEQLVQESWRLERLGAGHEPAVMAALRETVQLFNRPAAAWVFTPAHTAALHHQALLLLTEAWLVSVLQATQALAAQWGLESAAGSSLIDAQQRLQAAAIPVRRLHLAWLEAAGATQKAQVRANLSAQLGLPLGAPLAAVVPVDAWAAWGQAVGGLCLAVGRVAAGLPAHAHGHSRERLRAQARRIPLAVATWTMEVTQPGEALHSPCPMSNAFWQRLWPQWAELADGALHSLDELAAVTAAAPLA